MELIGFFLVLSLILNVYLFIKKYDLLYEIRWLNKDREKLRNDYLEILDKFYDTIYTEENGYMVINTKLKDNIKILDEN